MANKVKVTESNYSCGPLQRDDIKVSIKYFFLVTVRTTQKTPRDHKERKKKKRKSWLFVYSTAFLAVLTPLHGPPGLSGR